jgi:hypothetical protein
MQTAVFARRPFFVEAVQVSAENFEDIAKWCGGQMQVREGGDGKKKPYILVTVVRPMNDRQKTAFVGDWVVRAGSSFRVYTSTGFGKSFIPTNPRVEEKRDIEAWLEYLPKID